jgi:hypothetical protein
MTLQNTGTIKAYTVLDILRGHMKTGAAHLTKQWLPHLTQQWPPHLTKQWLPHLTQQWLPHLTQQWPPHLKKKPKTHKTQFQPTRYACENSKLHGNWCSSWCTQSSHWRNTGHRSLGSTFPTACPHRSANLCPKSNHSRSHSTWKPCK